jgi:hypothetical protein
MMRELLKPTDELLKMSESGKAHLGHVLNRWKDLLRHLTLKKDDITELEEFIQREGVFSQRFKRQVLPIHIVAYYLMPETTLHDLRNPDRVQAAIPLNFEQQISDFFRRHTASEDEYMWYYLLARYLV